MVVERLVGTAILRVTGVFCMATAVVAVVDPRQPTIPFDRVRMLVILSVAGVVLAAAPRLLRGRFENRRLPRPGAVALVLTVGGSIVSTALALALRYNVGWDAHIVGSMSLRLSVGRQLSHYQLGYLSRYPNNLPLLAIDNWCHVLGRAWGTDFANAFIVLNGLCLAITLQSTYWLVSMLRTPRAGLAAQLLVLGMVGLSPWMSVPYTDVIAMPFVVASTALVVAAARCRQPVQRGLLVVLSVAALLAGYEIKTTPVVSVVAIGCVVALGLRSAPVRLRRTLMVGFTAGFALFLLGTVVEAHELPTQAHLSASEINRSLSPPPVWWIYMGTTQHIVNGQPRYGAYDKEIVSATYRKDRNVAGRYAAAHLKKQLSRLGVIGYARFAANKAAWNWGDGMFWAWSEGTDYHRVSLSRGKVAEFVHTWNRPDGAFYGWRGAAAQDVWLLLLLTVGTRLIKARWRWELGYLALSVLGIAAFSIVFQGRSRYLLAYVPIVVSLGCVLPALVTPQRPSMRPRDSHDPSTQA